MALGLYRACTSSWVRNGLLVGLYCLCHGFVAGVEGLRITTIIMMIIAITNSCVYVYK